VAVVQPVELGFHCGDTACDIDAVRCANILDDDATAVDVLK
jgi:hypothetical protein